MDHAENIEAALRRAIDRERELWVKVRGKLPGEAECTEELWKEWRKSAQLVNVLGMERARMLHK